MFLPRFIVSFFFYFIRIDLGDVPAVGGGRGWLLHELPCFARGVSMAHSVGGWRRCGHLIAGVWADADRLADAGAVAIGLKSLAADTRRARAIRRERWRQQLARAARAAGHGLAGFELEPATGP